MPRNNATPRQSGWYRLMLFVSMLAVLVSSQSTQTQIVLAQSAKPSMANPPLAVLGNHLNVKVVSASNNATQVTTFKYIINIDNTGTTAQRSPADGCSPASPGYPESCKWVSVAGAASNSPIFTQGDQTDFGPGIDLPDGRYLISVLADGYKIDGAHFTIPVSSTVTVEMQPDGLPSATVQAAVFEDSAPTNSAPDLPAERGLAGFAAHIKDYIDEVTTDVAGDPLCGNSHCLSKCYVVDNGTDIGTVAPVDGEGRCPIAFDPANDPLLSVTITQTIEGNPIPIGAVVEGKVIIPNLGPNRYALSVVPPNNSAWVQTTTLEGNHDWDAWVMEGATGLDTEFSVGGEPFPATFFGFVKTKTLSGGSGEIKGVAVAVSAYIPPVGGTTGELGLNGAKPKDKNPIQSLYVSLSDLNNSDQTVYTGHFVCNQALGCPSIAYDIPNVPDGDYVIGLWDEPQDFIFQVQNVSVRNGEIVDMGAVDMLGWWTTIEGHVFSDLNENGKMDPGEPGIPNFFISMRKRENSLMDRGTASITTDANGYYYMESAYPQTQWMIEEAYADGFQTTGITYQADNQPTETTILGQGVDVNVHPVIGLGGRLDWGVKAYAPGTNGGIVGTLSYDTTRNELDAAYSKAEDWQPSIPNLTVDLYAPVDCTADGLLPCDANGFYQLDPDGSYSKGLLLNQYVSETWERPTGCVARNVNGEALVHNVDEKVLPLGANDPCLEAPMMGVQFGPLATDVGTPNENFGASLDGNYGFGDGCFETGFNSATSACNSNWSVTFNATGDQPQITSSSTTPTGTTNQGTAATQEVQTLTYAAAGFTLTFNGETTVAIPGPATAASIQAALNALPGINALSLAGVVVTDTAVAPTALPSNSDFLVKVNIPTEGDVYGAAAVHPAKPMYQVTREEDINIANGDSYIPQVPPSACAGALHTVDVAGDASGHDAYAAVSLPDPSGLGSGTINVPASAPVENPTFVGIGGTIYEGQQKPLCDTKLVHVSDRKSIAPSFTMFTDVPLPGRFWGLIVDDLNFSSNPQSVGYGEKMGVPFAPVGIYDYTDRLITTVESDYNGLFDVLLPSTNRISCPTPSGVCANLYRFVGNDPGIKDHWNANYNPQYRTIAAEFEAFPGLIVPADLAPTQVSVAIQLPGMQVAAPISCSLETTQPQLLAVSKPYANVVNGADSFSIDGFGFGSSTGQVLLDNPSISTVSLSPSVWSDGHISVTVPSSTPAGVYQLSIQNADNGLKTINGLSFHVFNTPTFSVPAFPINATLDAFTNRNNLGANWNSNGPAFDVINNTGATNDFLRIRVANNTVNNAWWNLGTGFGTNQEAFFTFLKASGNPSSNEQGLLLKYSGGTNPNGNNARWVEVTVDNNNTSIIDGTPSVRVRTKLSANIVNQYEIATSNASFGVGDQLGARALSNGTIIVYKNGSEIGRTTVAATGAMTGRIGVRFEGTGTLSSVEARIDDFGGGNVTIATNSGSAPSLFEVGPGHAFSNIQSALDAAASQSATTNSLVVVYPGASTGNPRYNGRGAYYENPIMYSAVKLQGVGPGGVRPDNTIVQGSIIDGSSFGGDTTLATNWLGKIDTLTWDGNQTINDGQVIYVLASDTGASSLTRAGSFGAAYNAAIDGFDIRGGDQLGLPGNLNAIFGGFPGPLAGVQVDTQGGAIFANSYVRNLQITNNIVESNGGSYGAIRIGTPNLPGVQADQQNDNLRVAHNRIIANGGTNLAGAIGLFNGAENYEIASNDFCGNFSAEYGGAISHFGYSPNGKIHDNRIYFNRSYDEGAGIMIAGELPSDPTAAYGAPNGPQGSGAVDIYNNLIQANLSDDDGGGLRFLMAGNFPMNVYNNMIVNNVSTHEGGGVAIDDAPAVNFFNNTVMKNITTATAITSDGSPAPAGLSTGQNSVALQSTLSGTAPTFSDPLLFNNIFWDNRAGSRGVNQVNGIGSGDANPWDLGVNGPGLLSPTNSILQQNSGVYPYTASPSNVIADPAVIAVHDIPLSFTSWRTNVNFIGAIMVTADLPPSLLGNYHLPGSGSPAFNLGAASKNSLSAPAYDIDKQARPALGGFDSGADEYPDVITDLSISKTDGQLNTDPGSAVNYTIVVTNYGPGTASGATVTDTLPASLTVGSWTCTASVGSSCAVTGSGNNRGGTITLLNGGSATFTANTTLASNASGTLFNTATVAVASGTTDSNPNNNTATDLDSIIPALPLINILDNFNRANSNNLGGNWSQALGGGGAGALRVNTQMAAANVLGNAYWNVPSGGFGSKQGAAFTFANAPINNTNLILKASGTPLVASVAPNFISVSYRSTGGGQVLVTTSTNYGLTQATRANFDNVGFAIGDTLSAVVDATGTVSVWKTSGASTTFLGSVTIPGSGFWTGTGRIGLQLPNGARIDDFRGGNLP